MKPHCGQREAGYLLIESVVLGMIALAAAAALVIFARGAVLAQQSAARDGAVYAARECLSTLEAQLDHEGKMSLPKEEEWTRDTTVYRHSRGSAAGRLSRCHGACFMDISGRQGYDFVPTEDETT